MRRRLEIHLGAELVPSPAVRIDNPLEAMKVLKDARLGSCLLSTGLQEGCPQQHDTIVLAHDLLAPPVLVAPLFHHVVRGVAFVSNCTAAYLLAQVDEATLVVTADQILAIPRLPGTLPEIQAAVVEWIAARTSSDILSRLENASSRSRDERHRRLALLRGHMTAMRWTTGGTSHLADIEALISSLIAVETRAWA